MGNVLQYDALDAPSIPLDPAKMPPLGTVGIASYCDGDFASGWIDCMHRFPTLAAIGWVTSIATQLTSIARVLDIEPGNPAKPAQAPQWVIDMLNHGVYLPSPYADENQMPEVIAALNASPHLKRSDYGLWLANPNGTVHMDEGFEATQSPFDGNFDISDCVPRFFPPLPKPKPAPSKPDAQGVAHFEGTVSMPSGDWTIRGTEGAVTWGTSDKAWMAQIGVANRDGKWQLWQLPFDEPGE